MMRWEIINHLIKENDYKTYLEIGYYKGWSFDRVECEEKTAIDPNPSRSIPQEQAPYGQVMGHHDFAIIYKMTSDDYFAYIEDHPSYSDVKWDIIFIDGLHESQQVDRDIENALKHLSPGGTIVMHDCNPSSYEMTTTGTVLGEWTGDVYKSFCKFRVLHDNICYVVDTDYGVGIIKDILEPRKEGEHKASNGYPLTWEAFDKNRQMCLNLISPEEFLKRETKSQETNVKTTTNNLSPA